MPETVVHAELLTSASAIEPGQKFLLAVRFEITPEYRISWSNPGDVGKSTRVSFQVPDGFVVGPLQFPAPERFELPGKLVNYGYQGETAVFAEVTAPLRLSRTEAYRFDVRADWLACKDDCATESLDAWFELVSMTAAPEPRLPEELRAHYEALPKSFSQLPTAGTDWAGSPERPLLKLAASDVKWTGFLLSDVEQPKLSSVKARGDALSLQFEGRSDDKPLRGLALGESEGKAMFFDVNLPWPSPDAIAPPEKSKPARVQKASPRPGLQRRARALAADGSM